MDASELIPELTENGIGSIYYEQFQKGSKVKVDEAIRWVFTEQKGGAIIE